MQSLVLEDAVDFAEMEQLLDSVLHVKIDILSQK